MYYAYTCLCPAVPLSIDSTNGRPFFTAFSCLRQMKSQSTLQTAYSYATDSLSPIEDKLAALCCFLAVSCHSGQ